MQMKPRVWVLKGQAEESWALVSTQAPLPWGLAPCLLVFSSRTLSPELQGSLCSSPAKAKLIWGDQPHIVSLDQLAWPRPQVPPHRPIGRSPRSQRSGCQHRGAGTSGHGPPRPAGPTPGCMLVAAVPQPQTRLAGQGGQCPHTDSRASRLSLSLSFQGNCKVWAFFIFWTRS